MHRYVFTLNVLAVTGFLMHMDDSQEEDMTKAVKIFSEVVREFFQQ